MQMLLLPLNPDRDKALQYALNPAVAPATRVFYADQFEVEFVDEFSPADFLQELCSRWTAFRYAAFQLCARSAVGYFYRPAQRRGAHRNQRPADRVPICEGSSWRGTPFRVE